MLNRIFDFVFKSPTPAPKIEVEKPKGFFTTDALSSHSYAATIQEAMDNTFRTGVEPFKAVVPGAAMDSLNIKAQFNPQNVIPQPQILWYASQSFIGYQFAALLAQHWLISKACLMPAKDATRNGYEITVNDGTDVDPLVLDAMRKADVRFKLNKNMIEFIQLGRVFGIRIALFIVENDDPEYYYKPFNPDGVTPGSYKGISQVDPYWITPQLDSSAAGEPGSINFYEPTWWRVSGVQGMGTKLIHRTHLIIFKTEELPDILKPTYIYGGVPIPQKIYERVYAAEKTANEAPMLAATKRITTLKVDLTEALTNEAAFNERIEKWVFFRDNYGIKVIGEDEEVNQFETSLADLDAVIMTQYQLVAAAANVPSVKLLGTPPKGFNATGEFEESNYHEELESIQSHDLTPLLERHHLLLIRSEIAPEFNIAPFPTTVTWNSLDAKTAKETAEINKSKAETAMILMNAGAIDGADERQRIINDPESGYSGLIDETPEAEIESDPSGA